MSPPDEAIVTLRGVRRVYRGGVVALRGVDLDIRRGELVAVVGPSGSGKSTLLHLMGTLDRPSGGTVVIDGFDIATLSDRQLSALRASRIGFRRCGPAGSGSSSSSFTSPPGSPPSTTSPTACCTPASAYENAVPGRRMRCSASGSPTG